MIAPVKAGDILAGTYKVERVLGQGGMGMVVLARHLQLGSLVAMKFMLPSALENTMARERFLREAQAAGRLRGENVARVMDFGTLETGSPYIVMEFLDGEDLDALTKTRGRLPVAEAVEYILQTCAALREAHEQGIVHRDLKPQNIFLTKKPDGSPLVKVLDFGISKLTDADSASLSVTNTQMVMGSPLYMSPEQIRSAKHVDARTDIYSVGIVLYQLVSGMHPYRASSAPELFAQVLMGQPAPLHMALPGVNPSFENVVMRAIAREREQRVQSMDELGRLLQPFRDPAAATGTLPSNPHIAVSDRTIRLPAPQIVVRAPGANPVLGATTMQPAVGSVPSVQPRPMPAAVWIGVVATLLVSLGAVGAAVAWRSHRSTAASPSTIVATVEAQPPASSNAASASYANAHGPPDRDAPPTAAEAGDAAVVGAAAGGDAAVSSTNGALASAPDAGASADASRGARGPTPPAGPATKPSGKPKPGADPFGTPD